jgi:sec-independent protein translocase protein TatA
LSIGFTEWMLIAVVVLFFGRGKVSELMGDVAKGIKSFKKGLAEDDSPPPAIETNADRAAPHIDRNVAGS